MGENKIAVTMLCLPRMPPLRRSVPLVHSESPWHHTDNMDENSPIEGDQSVSCCNGGANGKPIEKSHEKRERKLQSCSYRSCFVTESN
jgi:hypothetical protein